MIFWIRKIVSRLFFPVPLVLELLLLGALLRIGRRTRKAGSCLMALAAALLFFLSLPICGNALLRSLEQRFSPLDTAALPLTAPLTVAVAGNGFQAAADTEGNPADGRFNDIFLVRLQEAGRIARALEQHGAEYRLAVSVTALRVSPEVKTAALERYFASFGIPAARILPVDHARNSKEEMAAFSRLPGRLVIVSSACHLPRLMQLAEKQGLQALPAPAGFQALKSDPQNILDWIPSAEALAGSRTAFYEYLGIAADEVAQRFHREEQRGRDGEL